MISRLVLTDFRNHAAATLTPGPVFVLLSGDNGAGKTNILEAVSLLTPGRGLRGASLGEMARSDGQGGFGVAARLDDDTDIGTGTLATAPERRQVRINGAAQLVGGIALATGKGRRLGALLLAGSLLPSTIAKHPFWTVQDPEERAQDRSHFLKNFSLLGGVLLAAQDTEGRPSLAYRAHKGGEALAKDARKATKKLSKGSSRAADTAGELADTAVAGGAALLGAVAASSRKVRKQAAKQLKEAKAVAAKQAEEAQEAAAKAAKTAKKEAKKQAKVVSKKAKKLGKNVQLGEN